MSIPTKRYCLAAIGAAILGITVAASAPAAACDIAAATDPSCGPTNANSANTPSGGGTLSRLFDETAAASVTPPDGYEPRDYPAAHHRHRRAHKPIE